MIGTLLLKTNFVSFYPIGKVPKDYFEFFVSAIFTYVIYSEVLSRLNLYLSIFQ